MSQVCQAVCSHDLQDFPLCGYWSTELVQWQSMLMTGFLIRSWSTCSRSSGWILCLAKKITGVQIIQRLTSFVESSIQPSYKLLMVTAMPSISSYLKIMSYLYWFRFVICLSPSLLNFVQYFSKQKLVRTIFLKPYIKLLVDMGSHASLFVQTGCWKTADELKRLTALICVVKEINETGLWAYGKLNPILLILIITYLSLSGDPAV